MSSSTPLSKTANGFMVKLVGIKNFIAINDLTFLLREKEEPYMKKYQPELKSLERNLLGGGALLLLSSLLLNIVIQKKIAANAFDSVARMAFFDLFWYTGTFYVLTNYAAMPINDPSSNASRIKSRLIEEKDRNYFGHLRQNSIEYGFSLEQLTKPHQMTPVEIELLLLQIRDLDKTI